MSSKTNVNTDSSANTATDSALVANKSNVGSLVATNGNIYSTATDFGSVTGGINLAGESLAGSLAFGAKALDFAKAIADGAGTLSRSSIEATQQAALQTTKQLDAAYAQAKGTINANTTTIVVVVMVVAVVVAAFAMRGGK